MFKRNLTHCRIHEHEPNQREKRKQKDKVGDEEGSETKCITDGLAGSAVK